MKRITDPTFEYDPSWNTDIRRRFAAVYQRNQRARMDRKRSPEAIARDEERRRAIAEKVARYAA